MSKKTEARSSSNSQATTKGAAYKETSTANSHTTAHELANGKEAMLTHKRRGDALLREDEREELMMTQRKESAEDDKDDKDNSEKESSGSLSGADAWNFALLVVLCKQVVIERTDQRLVGETTWTPLFVSL